MANLFTVRVRGKEEVKVELAELRRGYSVHLRLRTYDQGLAQRVYGRLLQLLEELRVEGFEELRPHRLTGTVCIPKGGSGG